MSRLAEGKSGLFRVARFRLIDPASGERPGMPLFVDAGDGEHVAEADSPAGAVAALLAGIGVQGYEELDDCVTAWHGRRDYAEKRCLAAAARGRWIAVEDQHRDRFGPVFDPAAQIRQEAEEEGDDPEAAVAEVFPPGTPREVIRIDDDRIFLAALLRLGLIGLREREDCRIMRPSPEWAAVLAGGGVGCRMCLYREGRRCVQFGINLDAAPLPDGGASCANFAPIRAPGEFSGLGRAEGAGYVDLATEPLVILLEGGRHEIWPPGRAGPEHRSGNPRKKGGDTEWLPAT